MMMVVAMAAMTTTAQDKASKAIEIMISYYQEADAMSNQPGGKKWRSEHVGFTEWDDGSVGMGLLNPPHIFIGGRDFMGNRKTLNTCKVGLYSAEGTLIWMAEKWKVMPGEGGTVLYFTKSATGVMQSNGMKYKSSPADLLKYLKENGGYVRFIADVFGDYYFDVSAKVK